MPHSKRHSINYLISKQPRWFKTHKDYNLMLNYFNASEVLQNLRITKKAYSILNNCRVSNDKLNYFYKVFKIPKNAFFPIFLKIKTDYLKDKRDRAHEKLIYIKEVMNNLDEKVVNYLKYFIKYEKSININRNTPVWDKFFFPKSKKKADEFSKFNRNKWIKIFFNFIESMNNYYNWIDKNYGKKLIALFILELEIAKYDIEKLKSQFRILSKRYHPDAGGDSESFNNLMLAKNIMLDKNKI